MCENKPSADLYEIVARIIRVDARIGSVRPEDVERIIAESHVEAPLANEVYAAIYRQPESPRHRERCGDPELCDYFTALNGLPKLSSEYADICFDLMEQNQAGAREYLIKAHLNEAAKIACAMCRKYASKNVMEAIGVANEQLVKCVDGYRRPSPATFKTYLNRSVGFAVHDALFEGFTALSMPARARRDCARIIAFQNSQIKETGAAPDLLCIASHLEMTEESVRDYLRAMAPMVALSSMSDGLLGDGVPDSDDEPIDDTAIRRVLLEQCAKDYHAVAATLTVKQRESLESYLAGYKAHRDRETAPPDAPSKNLIYRRARSAIASLREKQDVFAKYIGSI